VKLNVRPATYADLQALARLDLKYPTGRYLALQRSGKPPEHIFELRWRYREDAPAAVYATYTPQHCVGLSKAQTSS